MEEGRKQELRRLKRIIGQMQGVQRMLESDRECLDVLAQTRAVSAAVKSLEVLLIEKHIKSCVEDALLSGRKKDVDASLDEVIELFKKKL